MLSLYQSQIFLKLLFLIEQINIINRTLFNRARREFEYFHFLKDKEVLRRHGNCKLCGEHPYGMHADAIRKLYRFAEEKELVENVRTNELLLIFYSFISRKGESLYKDCCALAQVMEEITIWQWWKGRRRRAYRQSSQNFKRGRNQPANREFYLILFGVNLIDRKVRGFPVS